MVNKYLYNFLTENISESDELVHVRVHVLVHVLDDENAAVRQGDKVPCRSRQNTQGKKNFNFQLHSVFSNFLEKKGTNC